MAENLLNVGVPGLGSVLAVLHTLHIKYEAVKEGEELRNGLRERLLAFVEEVNKMEPSTLNGNELLGNLLSLINEYLAAVDAFAERSFVKRVLRLEKFKEAIGVYHERLDYIIKMITVRQTEKLDQLLDWRMRYEHDAVKTVNQLTTMINMQNDIYKSFQEMKKTMASKSDIENFLLEVKRGLSDSGRALDPLDNVKRSIVRIGEKGFLDDKKLRDPPAWLIAEDEVVTTGEPIDTKGHSDIFVGDWRGAQVAVKKFKVTCANPIFDKQFRVWSTLLHPHVVQLFGAGSEKGSPFFVCEYASRQSLDRCWGQVSKQETWKMLYQASLGLLYLRGQHIVHGNLSCSKLLVTEHGNVKLFGFGASYVRKNNKSNSLKAPVREDFAAPECIGIDESGQFTGSRKSPSFESDVYSFGLTIMEAIAKKDPFADMSEGNVRRLKQTSEFVKPAAMLEKEWALVMQMCVLDRTKRASLAYVSDLLRQFSQPSHHPIPS